MFRNVTYLGILSCIILMGATSAKAVTIDLNSPQEGSTVGPGEMLELTVNVTNDTDEKDIVFVRFELTLYSQDFDREIVVGRARPLRFRLNAGETATRTIAVTIPETLPELPFGTVDVNVDATARGVRSKTEDSDNLSFILDI